MGSAVTWIFSGVGITIVLGLLYLAKRYLYHLKFEPIIKVAGHDEGIIELPKCQPIDLNAKVNEAVSALDKSLPKYNVSNLDPYLNPWLVTPYGQNQIINQQHYMIQRTQYLNSYRTYQFHYLAEQEDNKAMVALPLVIENKGRGQGNNIEIELSFKGMFYDKGNRSSRQATRIKRPIDIGQNNISIAYTQLEQENYVYHIWNLKTPISSPQCFRKTHMNPKGADKEPFFVFYVNTRETTNLSFHWKVFESSLPNPVEGDVSIRMV